MNSRSLWHGDYPGTSQIGGQSDPRISFQGCFPLGPIPVPITLFVRVPRGKGWYN